MKILAVIPARYSSTRFPGKPLALIGNKPMIQWVYERASMASELLRVVVATDDERISAAVSRFGGEAVLTSKAHENGTARCLEVLQMQQDSYDILINIQGDEPLVKAEQISTLAKALSQSSADIATLARPAEVAESLFNPGDVKVVLDINGNALYFSRSEIPFIRDIPREQWPQSGKFLLHVGMYAFMTNRLHELVHAAPTPLEESEKLEQLRWLEHGYKIKVAISNWQSPSVDTPADLEYVNNLIRSFETSEYQ